MDDLGLPHDLGHLQFGMVPTDESRFNVVGSPIF